MDKCFRCGKIGHKKSDCYQGSSSRSPSTVKSYDCGQMVVDLKSHRPTCLKSSTGKTFASTPSSVVRCYDCNLMVVDLKSHRLECQKPVFSTGQSSVTVTTATVSSTVNVASRASGDIKKLTKDCYFLLDVSGSMAGSQLTEAKKGVQKIVDGMNPLDRMAIITFDDKAFFRLKPRPIEEIKRKNELPELLDRIFASGRTALYDAIVLGIDQIRDKSQHTLMIVLTDGQDNSSVNNISHVTKLLEQHPNVSLNIIEIGGETKEYSELCAKFNGIFKPRVTSLEIITIITQVFIEKYQ